MRWLRGDITRTHSFVLEWFRVLINLIRRPLIMHQDVENVDETVTSFCHEEAADEQPSMEMTTSLAPVSLLDEIEAALGMHRVLTIEPANGT